MMSGLDVSQLAALGAAFSATVVVPLVSLIKKESWPTPVKFFVALALSAVVATLQTVTQNAVSSWHNFAMLWGIDLAATQAVYQMYFGNSNLDTTLTNALYKPALVAKHLKQAPPQKNA